MAEAPTFRVGGVRLGVAGCALLVPLVVDPFTSDTQGYKKLFLALLGCAALGLEAVETLRGRRAGRRTTWTELALLGLVAWSAASLAWATNPLLGLLRVLTWVGALGLMRTVIDAVGSERDARGWLGATVLVASAAALVDAVGILQRSEELHASAFKYASTMFVHANMGAVYVAMVVPLAAALAFAGRRLVWLVPLAGLSGYVVLLRSRAGVLAIAAAAGAAAVLLVLRRVLPRIPWPSRGVTVALIAVLTVLPMSARVRGEAKDLFHRALAAVTDRPTVEEQTNASFRPVIWRKTLELVREQPWSGVGAGNFAVEFRRIDKLRASKPHVHNDGLQMLAELGIPGLFLFVGLLFAPLAALRRRLLATVEGPADYASTAALGTSLVAFAVGGLFEVPFLLGSTAAVFAVVAGIVEGLARDPAASSRGSAGGRGLRLFAAAGTLAFAVVACGYVLQRLPASAVLAAAAEDAEEGRVDEAIARYERVDRMATGSDYPLWKRAQLLLDRDRAADAVATLERARSLWPYGPELYLTEARALLALGRADEAVERVRDVVDLNPGEEAQVYALVEALRLAGRVREAVALLERQLRRDPGASLDAYTAAFLLWREAADGAAGEARAAALVAARHYAAYMLQYVPAEQVPVLDEQLAHLTHQLQTGWPLDDWWAIYRRFLNEHGEDPDKPPPPALYTSTLADGVALFPGWAEAEGPPAPRR